MLKQYREWIKERQEIQPIVFDKLRILLENHPDIEKVYLTGSYHTGDWIDEDSEQWEKELRFKIKNKSEISDIDFYTIPLVKSTKDYDIVGESKNKRLIYDNGSTII